MEAPHVYLIDGWYYLMTAEGGTQTNHCVRFYRSRSLTGGYEPCPRNPVVSNRGLRMLNALGVSVAGHGDLVRTEAGEWYMVLLGIRPYEAHVDDYERFSRACGSACRTGTGTRSITWAARPSCCRWRGTATAGPSWITTTAC